MASIVIAGDTSGSVTLQAPAVAGSTVLNLPSTSGTIQTSGAGYTTNGVAYATSATGLATGSALTFDGTNLTTTGYINVADNSFTGAGVGLGDASSWRYLRGSSGYISAFVNNSEQGRWTTTGLGIGTSSPTSKLHIKGSGLQQLTIESTTTNPVLFFGTASGQNPYIQWQSTGGSALKFYDATVGLDRLVIDSAGNVGIGPTSPSEKLDVGGFVKSTGLTVSGTNVCTIASSNANSYVLILSSTNATPASEYIESIRFTAAAPNNTSARFLEGGDTGGDRFVFRSNGGLANYSANDVNLSDRREKTNFAPATSYLDKICAIPVQTYNYIDQNLEEDAGLTLGVVAQDVQAVAPELVMESNWAGKDEEPKMRLSIYQTDLQYALMKCIQEQQALITTLTERISVLENK